MSHYYSSPRRLSGASSGPNSPLPASMSSVNSSSNQNAALLRDSGMGSPASSPLSSSSRFSHHATSASASAVAAQAAASSGGSSSSAVSRLRKKTRTIVVLGFSMVGKTSLCVRFVSDRFDTQYEPTYSGSFMKSIRRSNSEIECIIKDTQGIGEQEIFRPEYGLGVHGYILVYSISSLRSFDVIQSINAKLINLTGSTNIPRILVGTKSDLAQTPNSSGAATASTELRQVTTAMGENLAARWNCPFAECSAKQSNGVTRAFSLLLDEIEKQSCEPERSTIATGLESIKGWFSGLCAGSGDDAALDLSYSHSSPASSLHHSSSSSSGTSTDYWTLLAKFTAWFTMFLTLAGISFAIYFGVTSSGSQDTLLSYTLFGFSLIVFIVTLVGIYGMRASSVELLTVYWISLALLIIGEIVVWLLLYFNISTFTNHVVFVSVAGSLIVLEQACASLSGQKLTAALNANDSETMAANQSAYEYHGSYHALYE